MLLPIAAILEHRDFNPDFRRRPELIHNMWILSVLFRFTSPSEEPHRSASREALIKIALKTPVLIKEEEMEYVTSTIEYNSVIRQDYIQNVSLYLFIINLFFVKLTFPGCLLSQGSLDEIYSDKGE